MNEVSIQNISKAESWFLASRPKTLLASVVPVIIGTSIAAYDKKFQPLAALIALICSLLIQIGTNFVNDLYDFLSGADTEERKGPVRVLASGLITIKEMRTAIILTFSVTFILGLYLVYLGGWIILLIGILSIMAGYAYTAGPFPLAYNGLGDIFVFIFFGLVATVGTHFVQALQFSYLALLASIPVGALITNILVVNNYRDIKEDMSAGKKTLAVIFGERFTRIQYVAGIVISYLVLIVVYFMFKQNLLVFLPLLSLPISVKLVKMIYTLHGKELNKTLELTAKFSALYGILFAVGILV